MNLNLSPAAWIALACLAGIVIMSGVALFAASRRGSQPVRPSPPPPAQPGPSFTRSWEQEDEKLKELAEKVKGLKKD